MLESDKEKAALWATEPLVVGLVCEVETQPGCLLRPVRIKIFVIIDYDSLISDCAKVLAG